VIFSSNSRVIDIARNESFTYTVDLKNLYKLEPEEYRVKVMFSPEADERNSIQSDNQLTFRVAKAVGVYKKSGIARINRFAMTSRGVSPAEVITLFLKAEKERNWDNYFKYLDMEKFINAYPEYVRIYNEAVRKNDLEEKEKIIIEFANFLKEEKSDYIISYQVQRELKRTEEESYVEAMVTRFSARSPFSYKYRYSLEKFDNLWLITDVEVTVFKGQKS
jgi:hypothetical protein